MRKEKESSAIFHPPPLPRRLPQVPPHRCPRFIYPLPNAANRLGHPGSSALPAPRTDILQWKSSCLLHGRGNRASIGIPAAPITTSPRSRGSDERRLAWRATSAESVRSPVGNHPKAARIGLASGSFRLDRRREIHSFLVLGRSDWFPSLFSQCKSRGIECEYPTESRRGVRPGLAAHKHTN